VLSGNEVALFDGALFGKTPQAFEEEFLPFAPAQAANCFTMSCQSLFSFCSTTHVNLRGKPRPNKIEC
jgi:hypothetical protein